MNRTFRNLTNLKSEPERPKFRQRPYTALITKVGEIVEYRDGIVPLSEAFKDKNILYVNYLYKNGRTKAFKRSN